MSSEKKKQSKTETIPVGLERGDLQKAKEPTKTKISGSSVKKKEKAE